MTLQRQRCFSDSYPPWCTSSYEHEALVCGFGLCWLSVRLVSGRACRNEQFGGGQCSGTTMCSEHSACPVRPQRADRNLKVRCMADLIPKSTCSMTDVACVCTNEYLIEAINNCVVSTCTIKESLSKFTSGQKRPCADLYSTATAKYSEVTCARTVRSRSKMIKVIAILGCILPTLAVILRVISRMTGAGGQWGIDDYIIVPTTFVSITQQAHRLFPGAY